MTETTNQLPATVSKEPPARQKLWPVWLVAILALIIAIALALWSWQQWNNHQAVMQTIESLKQDTAQLEDLYGDRGSQQSQRLLPLPYQRQFQLLLD